jgi:hypothetical protein
MLIHFPFSVNEQHPTYCQLFKRKRSIYSVTLPTILRLRAQLCVSVTKINQDIKISNSTYKIEFPFLCYCKKGPRRGDNHVPRVGFGIPDIDVLHDPMPSWPAAAVVSALLPKRRGGVGARPTRRL